VVRFDLSWNRICRSVEEDQAKNRFQVTPQIRKAVNDNQWSDQEQPGKAIAFEQTVLPRLIVRFRSLFKENLACFMKGLSHMDFGCD